uniref:probable terpene synthase 11 n=1 Tax=Erigeron canadensis TaxID=72917 RepID=UPI001CB9724B|nr:probable terpene synthase 11 [Erigeron canadensis]
MASQYCINLLVSKTNGFVITSNAQRSRCRLIGSSTHKTTTKLICRFKSSLPHSLRANIAMPTKRGSSFPIVDHRQSMVIPFEVDVTDRIDILKKRTRELLMTTSNPTTTLNLIETMQRLGIGYSFEDEIEKILENLVEGPVEEDLYTTALRFRLRRQQGLFTNPDVFTRFMDPNGRFIESLSEDVEGLLSLYEASYLGAIGEDVLSQAKEFTTTHLKQKSVSQLSPKLHQKIQHGLELPKHMRMARLEAKRYIEKYGNETDHIPMLLELAKLDYNQVQSLHQTELAEITRWWTHLGLTSKLTFGRDRPLECFLWTVGILPDPKYSFCRIELAKTISMVLVIDDIFDTYGPYDDLVLFTKAIQRWDLDETEQLPEYMKICYMALYNTTNEIGYEVLKRHGLSILPFLRKTWIDMIEAFMVEAEWVKSGTTPSLKDYIENGIKTAGTYMALVHIFFLIGEGVTVENMNSLLDPYPGFFFTAGSILRLWDDLGTSKEEQDRGDVASSIQLFMKENNITCEEEGRNQILQLIENSWKELNLELVVTNKLFPHSIINVAHNMSRTAQVVYQHDDDSYFSSVDNHVRNLFFDPIDI